MLAPYFTDESGIGDWTERSMAPPSFSQLGPVGFGGNSRFSSSLRALSRIVNYTRSARSVPPGPGDAPFHPLYGQDFEFVACRQNWGEDRVHLHDENGQLFSLPAGWTDVAAADPSW